MKLLFLLIPTLFYVQNKWEVITNLNGRFQVEAPGLLNEKVDTIEAVVGKMVYHTYFMQEESDDEVIYMLSYCDYPSSIVFEDSTDLVHDFFSSTIETAKESVGGKLMYESPISINDHPGRIWRIDYLDGAASIKTKAYLVKNRFYSIQTIVPKTEKINLASDRFLKSFRLLE